MNFFLTILDLFLKTLYPFISLHRQLTNDEVSVENLSFIFVSDDFNCEMLVCLGFMAFLFKLFRLIKQYSLIKYTV